MDARRISTDETGLPNPARLQKTECGPAAACATWHTNIGMNSLLWPQGRLYYVLAKDIPQEGHSEKTLYQWYGEVAPVRGAKNKFVDNLAGAERQDMFCEDMTNSQFW